VHASAASCSEAGAPSRIANGVRPSEAMTGAQQEMFGDRPERVGGDERQGGHDDRRADEQETEHRRRGAERAQRDFGIAGFSCERSR
jgi:hypothetical protein